MRKDYTLTPTSRDGKPRRPIEIVMTPMIDVIFLLLVFFLATSSFQLVEQLMPSSVSETEQSTGNSDQPPPEPTDDAVNQVVINLEMQNGLTVAKLGGVVLPSLEDLKARLKTISQSGGDSPVIIDPEPEVTANDFVRVYDWAREVGLARVYLAIRK
ncbi:MAG: biopolymer transporter ExbD [Planctomycetota bacterium]